MPSPWGQIITQAIFHPSALYTNVQVETAKSEMPMIEKETARNLNDMGLPIEQIAQALKVNAQMVQEWLAGSVSTAR